MLLWLPYVTEIFWKCETYCHGDEAPVWQGQFFLGGKDEVNCSRSCFTVLVFKKKKRGRESWPLILCSDWRRSINGYQTETLVIYTTPCRFHTKGWGKQHAFFYKLNRIWRDRKCMWFSTTIFLFLKVYLSTILMGFPGVSFYFIPFITAEDLQ